MVCSIISYYLRKKQSTDSLRGRFDTEQIGKIVWRENGQTAKKNKRGDLFGIL